MTDNLRDKIAAAISDAGNKPDADVLSMADAVIAELSLRHVIDYCERQAVVGWRDVGTADEAMGRNIVAESVLDILVPLRHRMGS